LAAGTIAVAIGAGASAHAESNQLSAAETPQSAHIIRGGVVFAAGGSEGSPSFAGNIIFSSAALVATNGGDSPLQTAASLPYEFSRQTTVIASRGHTSPAS
jgi:hypothetical protein